MIKALWRRFVSLDFLLKLIWLFCLLGVFCNIVSVYRDMHASGILLRLHLGFLVLYLGQVVFILVKERMVCVLSVLQAAMALITNADFTFVPVLRILSGVWYVLHGQMSLEQIEVYKYVFISACFTLEMLKSYLLFALLTPIKKNKQDKPAEIE